VGEVGQLPPKKDVARALLLRGSLFVHLDPRVDGVRVPAWLAAQPQLVLQVGLDMAIPIPDLRVDDDGVRGTLSFQRSPFECRVPWDSIFALVGDDGRGMVWPDSMPFEIASEVAREADRRAHPAAARSATMKRPALTVHEGDGERDAPARASGERPRAIPSYLRLVK
jgi:stringent starvation protein B